MNKQELVKQALLKAAQKGQLDEAFTHDPKVLAKLGRTHHTTQHSSDSWYPETKVDTSKAYNLETDNNEAFYKRRQAHDDDSTAHNRKLTDLQYSGKHYGFSYQRADSEHKPLFDYSKSSVARRMNTHLINAHSPGTMNEDAYDGVPHEVREKEIQTLHNHIKKHAMPLPEEGHFYSGVKFDMKKVAEKGNIFHTPAFTSTSTSQQIAAGFKGAEEVKDAAEDHNGSYRHTKIHDSHIIHFKLPKGYRDGMAISPVSDFENEHEYLLNKGQNWKIVGHQRVNQTSFTNHKHINSAGQPGRSDKSHNIRRIHIWTVVPHDEHKLNEALEHNPKQIRRLTRGHTRYNKEYYNELWDSKKNVNHSFDVSPENRDSVNKDVAEHNKLLSKAQYGEARPSISITDRIEIHTPVNRYTQTSPAMRMNNRLITQSAHKYSTNSDLEHDDGVHRDFTHTDTHIKELSSHIKKHAKPLDHDGHFYSGVKFDMKKVAAASKNGVIHTPAFTSTSTSLVMARGYTGDGFEVLKKSHHEVGQYHERSVNDHHIIHFKLPKGYKKGVWAAPVSNYEHEHEYILDKGQKWKITGHERVNDTSMDRTEYHDSKTSNFTVNRIHIWTVEPHTPIKRTKKLTEALEHNVESLRSLRHVRSTVNDTNWTSKVTKDYARDGASLHPEYTHVHDKVLTDNQYGKSFIQSLTKEQHLPLTSYTDDGNTARKMNVHLIRNSSVPDHNRHFTDQVPDTDHEFIKQKISDLSKHIETHAKPLDHEGHFYSGVRFDLRKAIEHGKGIIHTPAFTSTSSSITAATGFTNKDVRVNNYEVNNERNKSLSKTISDEHIIHFKLPKGYKKGIWAAPVSHYSWEHEYTLDKDQKWKVVGHKRVNQTDMSSRKHVDGNNNQTYHGKSKDIRRIHIWTVVPHDEHLTEAVTHNPDVLRKVIRFREAYEPEYTYKRSEFTKVDQESHDDEIEAQHERLSEHQYGEHWDSPLTRYELKDKHNPAYNYTINSSDVNHHLIKNSGLQYPQNRSSTLSSDISSRDPVYDSHVADTLQKHLEEHSKPLPEDVHAYSGVNINMHSVNEHHNGIFKTPAFTSTSLDIRTARDFGQTRLRDDSQTVTDKHIIHFKLPKGYKKAMYVEPITASPGENELILHKNQKWKIVGHQQVKHTNMVSYGTNASKERKVNRVHIWTVEPHEETDGGSKKLTEATVHNPDLIRNSTHTKSKFYGDWSHPKFKSVENLDAVENNIRDIDSQHERLANHQYGKNFDKYEFKYGEGKERNKHIVSYTVTSKLVNHHLIMNSEHDHSKDGDFKTTAVNYRRLNHPDITDDELNERITNISKHITEHAKPLPENVHVYAGVGLDLHKIHQAGGKFHTPAFTSTSINIRKARDFGDARHIDSSNETNEDGTYSKEVRKTESHIIHFKLPKGYRGGIYAAPFSDHPHEQEMILDKGQDWQITGHHVVKNRDYRTSVFNEKGSKSRTHNIHHHHIWTVEPHDKPVTGGIHESFTHDIDSHIGDRFDLFPARRKLNPKHQEEHDALTSLHGSAAEDHAGSVSRFTGISFELNHSLNKDKPVHPMWESTHQGLQDMFKKTSPLEHEHHVYSGLGDFDPTLHFNHSDGVFKIKSYLSTSIDPTVAVAHTNVKDGIGTDSHSHLIHFKLPKGYTGGHYVASQSKFPGEHEMILNHGQKFKVVDHKKYNTDGKIRHVWSVVPHD